VSRSVHNQDNGGLNLPYSFALTVKRHRVFDFSTSTILSARWVNIAAGHAIGPGQSRVGTKPRRRKQDKPGRLSTVESYGL
jgi:hypothetical protein